MTTPVDQHASEPSPLPLNQLTLIGLISGPGVHLALLRSPSGDIARVNPGDRAFGQTVSAINDTQVILTGTFGQTTTLTLP